MQGQNILLLLLLLLFLFIFISQWNTDCLFLVNLADTNEANFQVTFPEQSVTDYIRLDLQSCVPPLTAFTVCMWLRTVPDAEDDTSFSYSVPGSDNEITIYSSARLSFCIEDDYV